MNPEFKADLKTPKHFKGVSSHAMCLYAKTKNEGL